MGEAKTGSLRMKDFAVIAGILLLAAALRGVILFSHHDGLNTDGAIIGLMAKHIFTRGETPLFPYSQPYAGDNALVAYLAAPLFALFGRSATLLTGISVSLSLVNIWLVWCITRRCFGSLAAACAAALYAFSPPVVNQSSFVSLHVGTFLFALVSLHFFLKSYTSAEPSRRFEFLSGLFAGLSYWAFDYAILYSVVFVLLWLACGSSTRWRSLAWFVGGFVIGCSPVLYYDLSNNCEHIKFIFQPLSGPHRGLLAHFFRAMWGLVSGDLALFFDGDLKGYQTPGVAAWFHAAVAVLATAVLVYQNRAALLHFLKSRPFLARGTAKAPVSLLPVIFVIVYLGIYGVAKFSFRPHPPRYLLPLCPFLSITIAAASTGFVGKKRIAALAVIFFLVLLGAVTSLQVGLRTWHKEERGVRTCGSEIMQLAEAMKKKGIVLAFAPKEIQWRLMFETDESVVVSAMNDFGLYGPYEDEVRRRVDNGEKFAFIFRRDFKFSERRPGRIALHNFYEEVRQRVGILPEAIRASDGPEDYFVIFFPLKVRS